ncbi:uncharacterized protein [Leptinotarsa decemlineata]|uniref:uncharacterized protein n=1 Tax=Leptinotarsa decemlineata TaxID=7539 RepID=UPI003D30C69B
MKISSYPGMSLRGEVRESISLDEDDLSDVEDEVFIRDGKNGYKLAEELNVKRPLMAPRRKLGKSEIGTRQTGKQPCRVFYKPCCYGLAALTVMIGLIILVVVLVSIYPLPLDWLRDWVIKKSLTEEPKLTLLPCDDLIVTDIWSVNLPKLTTDSAIRTLDVNDDGIEDILFGFGTGDNYDKLPADTFCPIFMGVPPPCEGGVLALNGTNGEILWRVWFNDTIYSLQCSADVNGDHLEDCLAVGEKGTLTMLNARNGSKIWQYNTNRMNIFVANFIPDQDNDNVSDVLASQSSLGDGGTGTGNLVLFSGKNGQELKRFKIPGDAQTFYMPQILTKNYTNSYVIFGTGSPSSGGNLSVNTVDGITSGKLTSESKTIYEDKFIGMMTQSVLVDITGDGIPDIITAMPNSSLVAIDGGTFQQIWNYTIPVSETNISPTPAFFNNDNVTDFLIVYQKYDQIFNYNYTQTFIVDGITGKSIYNPIAGSVSTQMSGLLLSFESHGYDMYLFWTSECENVDTLKKVDLLESKHADEHDECRSQFNTTRILKLHALNQFQEPPGFTVYNSAERKNLEFTEMKTPTKQLKEYYKAHPKINIQSLGQSEVDENYNVDPSPPKIRKYGTSSFRHKDHNGGLIESYMTVPESHHSEDRTPQMTEPDYEWVQNQQEPLLNNMEKIEPNFDDYQIDDTVPYNQKHLLIKENLENSNRDPRSKDRKTNNHTSKSISKTRKKDLFGEKNGIYDYRNVRLSRNRLLRDVDYIPTDIFKDTFIKNEEMRLRKSKFEQRDVNTHTDKIKEKEEIRKIIDKELEESKKSPTTLWDLESEKEMEDWVDGNYRGKRDINYASSSISKITSVGAIVDSINVTNGSNSIDIVFIKYWIPTHIGHQEMLKQDIKDCIDDKIKENSEDTAVHKYQKTISAEQRILFEKECLEEQESLKIGLDYFQQLYKLRLGQMTVYRLRLECKCMSERKNARCAEFLPKDKQNWPSYLGRFGDGVFPTQGYSRR